MGTNETIESNKNAPADSRYVSVNMPFDAFGTIPTPLLSMQVNGVTVPINTTFMPTVTIYIKATMCRDCGVIVGDVQAHNNHHALYC